MLKLTLAKSITSIMLGAAAITGITYGASQLLSEDASALEKEPEVVKVENFDSIPIPSNTNNESTFSTGEIEFPIDRETFKEDREEKEEEEEEEEEVNLTNNEVNENKKKEPVATTDSLSAKLTKPSSQNLKTNNQEHSTPKTTKVATTENKENNVQIASKQQSYQVENVKASSPKIAAQTSKPTVTKKEEPMKQTSQPSKPKAEPKEVKPQPKPATTVIPNETAKPKQEAPKQPSQPKNEGRPSIEHLRPNPLPEYVAPEEVSGHSQPLEKDPLFND